MLIRTMLELSFRRLKMISWSVRGNIEVADQEFTAEVGELPLPSGHKVDQPEVFVPDVPFQHNQDRPPRQE